MRDLISKAMTGAVVAGALLVSACGGDDAAVNNMATDMNAMDPMMDTTNDVTAIDAGTGADMNMTGDMNMSMDNGMMMNNSMSNSTDMNMTNGM